MTHQKEGIRNMANREQRGNKEKKKPKGDKSKKKGEQASASPFAAQAPGQTKPGQPAQGMKK